MSNVTSLTGFSRKKKTPSHVRSIPAARWPDDENCFFETYTVVPYHIELKTFVNPTIDFDSTDHSFGPN